MFPNCLEMYHFCPPVLWTALIILWKRLYKLFLKKKLNSGWHKYVNIPFKKQKIVVKLNLFKILLFSTWVLNQLNPALLNDSIPYNYTVNKMYINI